MFGRKSNAQYEAEKHLEYLEHIERMLARTADLADVRDRTDRHQLAVYSGVNAIHAALRGYTGKDSRTKKED